MKIKFILGSFLLLGSMMFGQSQFSGGGKGKGITITTVAGLATVSGKTNGTIAVVINGSSGSDCTVGGGANLVTCQFNGTSWGQLPAASSGATAFSAITGATNTAALLMGTGGSLGTSGSGTISATSAPLSGISGLGSGVGTFLGTPSSANLLAALTTKTGTGSAVFGTAPTISSPILSTAAQLSYITGSTQCLHVDTSGNITGTGSDCGAGGGSASGSAGAVQISAGAGAFTNQANIKASVANGYFGNSDTVSLQYPLDISRGGVTPIAMTTAPFNTIAYFNHSLDNPIGGTAGDVRAVQIALTYTGLGSNGTFASSYNQQTANLCNGGTACASPQVDTHNLVDVARIFANPGTNGTLTVADAFYGTASATPAGGAVTSLFTFHADGGTFNGTGSVGTVAAFVADMESTSGAGPTIGSVFGYRAGDPSLYGHGTGSGCSVAFLAGAGCGGNTSNWAFYDQTNQNSALHALSVGKTTAPGSPLDVVGNINSSTGFTIAGGATNGNCLVGNGSQFVSSGCLTAAQLRHTCMIIIGAENSAGLANADISPQNHQCMIPAASTVIEVDVEGDSGGTPSMNLSKNHAGSQTGLLSGSLSTGAAGAIACSNTGGTTGIDGATTCSSTLTTTALAAGDWIDVTAGAANSAKRLTIAVHYTTP